MTTDRTDELDLPDDLIARMQRLAEAQTADSRPFPRVDTAIRRSRITRYSGMVALAGAVVAAVVGVEVLTGGPLDRAQQGLPANPEVSATTTTSPSTPQEAGYSTQTAGSLASDSGWLADLRDQFHARDDWRASQEPVIAAADVQVVAAGDIEDRARYAVVLYHWANKGRTYWDRSLLVGPAGAAAAAMDVVTHSGEPEAPDQVPNEPDALFHTLDENRRSDAFVVVVAPGATSARIATSRTFAVATDGAEQISSGYASVPQVGNGIWAGVLTEDEFRMSDYAVELGGSFVSGNSSTTVAGYDLTAVAEPGTDPSALELLGGTLSSAADLTSAQLPVWSASIDTGHQDQVAAALFRSPGDVYMAVLARLWSDPDDTSDPGGDGTVEMRRGYMLTRSDSAAGAMAGLRVDDTVLVVAPQNATQVRMGTATATVKNRLALLQLPDTVGSTTDGQVEALSADGSVIARVTPKTAPDSMVAFTREPDRQTDGKSVIP